MCAHIHHFFRFSSGSFALCGRLKVPVLPCSRVLGADLLKLTREDVIQICGPADGIRLFNALKGRWVDSPGSCFSSDALVDVLFYCASVLLRVVRPRLTIYVCQESQQTREQQVKHENGDAAINTFFGQ